MSDILADSNDLALGRGWYPVETYLNTRFRWVANDAELFAATLRPGRYSLKMMVEPGPGLNLKPFTLQFLDEQGALVADPKIVGKQRVNVDLNVDAATLHHLRLHVAGGGAVTKDDPRVLNFRIFELSLARGPADVFPFAIKLGKGWHSLEEQNGVPFRWVINDAEAALPEKWSEPLIFEVESGPGLDAKPFELQVFNEGEKPISTVKIDGRKRVELAGLREHGQSIRLHVDGGGKRLTSDPRIMNFRVMRILETV